MVAEAGLESSLTQTLSTTLHCLFVGVKFTIIQMFDLGGECDTTYKWSMDSHLQFMSSSFCFHSVFQNICSTKLATAEEAAKNTTLIVNLMLTFI